MAPIVDINLQYYKSDESALETLRTLAASKETTAFVVTAMNLNLQHSPDFPLMSMFATSNEQMAQLASKVDSGKLIPFCYIDPTADDALKTLQHWIQKQGMRGVKMYPPRGFYVDDPRALDVFRAAQDLNVPVFLHMGRTAAHPQLDSKYARPLQLERVGLTCPKLRVIIGHFASPWSLEAADIAMGFEHFYFDLSTAGAWDLGMLKRVQENPDMGVRRLVYGSNSTGTTTLATARALETKLRSNGFSAEACSAIFRKNALGFLRLL